MERSGRSGSRGPMHFVHIYLTLMIFLDVFEEIRLHSQPVIPCSENFLSHGMFVGVSAKGSFVDLFDKHAHFVSV